MSKRNLLNLILLVFIAILATIVIYEPGKNVAAKPPTLTNLNKKDIKQIKITRHVAHGTSLLEQEIELEKTSDGWKMTKPYAVPANSFRIDSILEILSTVSYSQNSLQDLNLGTFGLEKPAATITFNNNVSLVFGHNKSLKNHRYIQIDSTLHLTPDTFFYQLAAKSESYINHKVLPKNRKITKLILPSVSLEKINGLWINKGISKSKRKNKVEKEELSADSANQLIDEWQLSQAYDVNKIFSKIKYSKDVTLHFDDGEIIHFNIEKNKKSFNLINISNRVRYILSKDRASKLLNLSPINEDKKE